MNELLPDAKTFVLWLFGIVMTLFSFIGRRQLKRLDAIEENYVTRDELAATLTEMRDDRQRMHDQNREDLQYIRERVDAISDRQQ